MQFLQQCIYIYASVHKPAQPQSIIQATPFRSFKYSFRHKPTVFRNNLTVTKPIPMDPFDQLVLKKHVNLISQKTPKLLLK